MGSVHTLSGWINYTENWDYMDIREGAHIFYQLYSVPSELGCPIFLFFQVGFKEETRMVFVTFFFTKFAGIEKWIDRLTWLPLEAFKKSPRIQDFGPGTPHFKLSLKQCENLQFWYVRNAGHSVGFLFLFGPIILNMFLYEKYSLNKVLA